MAEILIVDDERALREGMKMVFEGEGFDVRTARDGCDALKKITEKRPDAVLLDVMMPKLNGFRTCEEIRKLDRDLPVIFLTAKDSECDQVRGIGLGADDYISKDASEAVLLARIRRAVERSMSLNAYDATFDFGKVKIDLERMTICGADGEVRLTATEAGILRLLSSELGRVFTKDEIISGLRGKGYACEDSMVYTHIYNIRKKLGTAAEHLSCDRHAGYRLVK